MRAGIYLTTLYQLYGLHSVEYATRMGDRNGDKHKQKRTKSKCENYRGITLLPRAYKLFTNIIKNRLNEHVEEEMVEEHTC